MPIDNRNLKFGASVLTEQLKAKNRQRRDTMTELQEATAAFHMPRNDLSPSLGLVKLSIEHLRLPARKVRAIDEAHVQEIARAIETLGFSAPILVGKNDLVIDGRNRVEAARRLGFTEISCVRVNHLTDSEQRLLTIAVNRLGEKGRWDLDELKIEFEELILAEAPIEIAGFVVDEIDRIVLGDDVSAIESGPLAPRSGAMAVSRPGDAFRLGRHGLVCGDATDAQAWGRLMDDDHDGAARLLLSDEPYNVPIKGDVSGSGHREFAMGSGEMSGEQ